MCLCEMYYHDIDIYNVCAYYRNKDNIFVLLSMGMWHNGCEEGQNGEKYKFRLRPQCCCTLQEEEKNYP